jgi:hypothetical protein
VRAFLSNPNIVNRRSHVRLSHTVDYSTALVFELHAASPEPLVMVQFKNGTTDADLHPVALGRFGANATSIPLSAFISTLQVRRACASTPPLDSELTFRDSPTRLIRRRSGARHARRRRCAGAPTSALYEDA